MKKTITSKKKALKARMAEVKKIPSRGLAPTEKVVMKKNIDPASLPKGKGIGTKPKTLGPNFVERNKTAWVKENQGANPFATVVGDRGSNPGGSPRIEYNRQDRFSPAKGKVSIDKMDNKGNFVKSNSMQETPSLLKRAGAGTTPKEAINLKQSRGRVDKKGTKPAPAKSIKKSVSKSTAVKKTPLKSTKK